MSTRKQPQLAAAAAPRTAERARIRARGSSRTVAALRQGPSLRKLLGSAGELWSQLQERARRGEGAPLRLTAKELALTQRPPRSLRTVEWGLHRLADAGLITRTRTRHGLIVQVLASDLDDDGLREYSPHLPASTLSWMRSQRKRGRPPAVHTRPQPALPESTMHDVPQVATTRRIEDHPLVPPTPYTPELELPRTPLPHLLDREARPFEHREFLIEAYVSAARAFYPRLSVQNACKFMRSPSGRRILDATAEVFMEHALAPQAWVGWLMRRDKPKRKAPMRPELMYEPTLIEKGVGACTSAVTGSSLYVPRVVSDPKHDAYIRGIYQLRALWEQTMRELRALERYDDAAITRIVQRYWPDGWERVYKNAEEKLRTIRNELDARVLRGEFIWLVE